MKSGSAPRRMIEAGVQSSSKRILNPGELSAPLKVHAERDAPFAPLSSGLADARSVRHASDGSSDDAERAALRAPRSSTRVASARPKAARARRGTRRAARSGSASPGGSPSRRRTIMHSA